MPYRGTASERFARLGSRHAGTDSAAILRTEPSSDGSIVSEASTVAQRSGTLPKGAAIFFISADRAHWR
jgi:hypothetical protein